MPKRHKTAKPAAPVASGDKQLDARSTLNATKLLIERISATINATMRELHAGPCEENQNFVASVLMAMAARHSRLAHTTFEQLVVVARRSYYGVTVTAAPPADRRN